MDYKEVSKSLNKLANKEKAKLLQRFFKTGKGQYGEGDIFLGIMVPEQRKVAKNFKDLSQSEIKKLLQSKIHEYRLVGLLILVEQFNACHTCPRPGLGLAGVSSISPRCHLEQGKIAKFYLANKKYVNNWDLVDLSAPKILGNYLFLNDRSVLYKLAKSKNLWDKRIAIVSTLYFISQNDFSDTLKISEILLSDKHDLIHKAVGWMLREVGKRDQKALKDFLKRHLRDMSRITLRYSIEKFPEKERKSYLFKKS